MAASVAQSANGHTGDIREAGYQWTGGIVLALIGVVAANPMLHQAMAALGPAIESTCRNRLGSKALPRSAASVVGAGLAAALE